MKDNVEAYVAWSHENYSVYNDDVRKLVAMAKFICEAPMSNYQMSNKQKLALAMLMEPQTWRAHQKQIFHYEDGAWVMVEGLRVKAWHILLALEGLFILVSNDTADIEWTWTKVEPYVEDICRKHAECSISQTLVDHLELVAKSNSDHLRVTTSNKVWTAKWTRRVAEMIAAYRKQWDDDCSTISPLSKLFLVEWDTAMPRSEGVCFSDVYLNATWQMATKSPDNNCYLRIGYPYFYEKTLQSYPGVSIQDFRNVLRTFLESVYFENEHALQLKLCFMKAAFAQVCTSRILFLVGKGGSGKGMDAILDKALFGSEASSTLDCGVFLDRAEFRKSAGLSWNKANIRIQEMDEKSRFIADIWKRFVVNEELDLRVNYGFTVKRTFGASMKVQELNYENIPTIEESGDRRRSCEQLKRRVVCVRLGKATFTTDENLVDHAKGIYKLLSQDTLTFYLSHPITAALFLREWCVPFFKENTVDECLAMIQDLGSVHADLVADTDWLATCLSGNTCLPPGSGDAKVEEANDLVKLVHSNTPAKRIIKQYLIMKVQDLPGAASSCKGRRTKLSTLTEAIDNAQLRIMRQLDAGCFEKLLVDWNLLTQCMETYGGTNVFGTFSDWGCPFDLLHMQEKWEPGTYEAERRYMEQHSTNHLTMSSSVSRTYCCVGETADMIALADYARAGTDRRDDLLRVYIQRHERDGNREGRLSVLHQEYYQQAHYGRCMARGPAGQKLTREARDAAFGSFCAEVDVACCHPRLLVARLQKCGFWDSRKFVMLSLFTEHYRVWRKCLADYKQETIDFGKKELIRVFYGGRPSMEAPFLLKLCDEVQRAADLLLGHSSAKTWSTLYADRRNPEFSRLSAMLSFDEAELLEKIVAPFGDRVNVLIFDGAYIRCDSFAQELDLARTCEAISNDLHDVEIKSWPRATGHLSFSRQLLRKGAVPESGDRALFHDNCLAHAMIALFPDVDPSIFDELTVEDTGLSAARLNGYMRHNGSNDSTSVATLVSRQTMDAEECGMSRWMCLELVGDEEYHWWGILFPETGGVLVADSWTGGCMLWASVQTFMEVLNTAGNLYYFQVLHMDTSTEIPNGAEYQILGRGPASASSKQTPTRTKEITTSLTHCCDCGAPLARRDEVAGRLYTLEGLQPVVTISKRCSSKSCRTTHHYNFRTVEGHKLHTAPLEDMEYVFINSKVGFSRNFLDYHAQLQFRGALSSNAIAFAQAETLWRDADQHSRWDQEYCAVQLYYAVLQEGSEMWSTHGRAACQKKLCDIDITDPLSKGFLESYRTWWHDKQLTKREWQKVREIVMDGHQKVAAKCTGTPPAHAGRPRKDGKTPQRQNGWFMAVDPSTGLVLSVSPMQDPENNEIATNVLLDLVSRGSQINCVIYDRMCACLNHAQAQKPLKQIKYWCIDRFHARAHSPKCACSPLNHRRLDLRLRNVNSSIAEQTFAWFRNYASSFNTKAINSHMFFVLVYVKKHNMLMRRNYMKHLNAFSAKAKIAKAARILRKPTSHKYVCRRPASSASSSIMKKNPRSVKKFHLKSKSKTMKK